MDSSNKKKIGQILCEKGYLNQFQLEQVLAEQQKGPWRQLGQILLELGYITTGQLDEILTFQGRYEDNEKSIRQKKKLFTD